MAEFTTSIKNTDELEFSGLHTCAAFFLFWVFHGTLQRSLTVPEVVENEDRMVTECLEVPVVGYFDQAVNLLQLQDFLYLGILSVDQNWF